MPATLPPPEGDTTIKQLQARLSASEAENARLREMLHRTGMFTKEQLGGVVGRKSRERLQIRQITSGFQWQERTQCWIWRCCFREKTRNTTQYGSQKRRLRGTKVCERQCHSPTARHQEGQGQQAKETTAKLAA